MSSIGKCVTVDVRACVWVVVGRARARLPGEVIEEFTQTHTVRFHTVFTCVFNTHNTLSATSAHVLDMNAFIARSHLSSTAELVPCVSINTASSGAL